jgi:Homeodomain-like domain
VQVSGVHPPHVREEVMALVAEGVNDCEIARRTGIPRATVRDWRRPRYESRRLYVREICPRCWGSTKPMRFTPEDYAELLAFYLGDGCISELPRTQKLRICLDAKYPQIIERLRALLARCFSENAVGVVRRQDSCHEVWVHGLHLGCLFPQHGPGKKHERTLALEPWQAALVAAAPWSFLRGCVYSDGCTFVNRTGPYEYLAYEFGNLSKDLINMFTSACDLVGLDYRVNRWDGMWRVRINRRASVAEMVAHVGLKA